MAQWFQILKTSHKISSFDVISRVFPSKFHLLPYLEDGFSTQSLSNCYRHKYDLSILRVFQSKRCLSFVTEAKYPKKTGESVSFLHVE